MKLKQLEIEQLVIKNIKNHFEHDEEKNCYKTVRVSSICSNSYIEYKRNSDGNKTLSVEEYLNKIRPYLKYLINNLKISRPQNLTRVKFN